MGPNLFVFNPFKISNHLKEDMQFIIEHCTSYQAYKHGLSLPYIYVLRYVYILNLYVILRNYLTGKICFERMYGMLLLDCRLFSG